MNYYVWFKGEDIVRNHAASIKSSLGTLLAEQYQKIDLVEIIMEVRKEIEGMLLSNFKLLPNYKDYVTMV